MWCVWTKAGADATPVPVLTTDDERVALARYETERHMVRSGKQAGSVWLTHKTVHLAHYCDAWNPPS